MNRLLALLVMVGFSAAASATVVTFDNGFEGWTGPASGIGGVGTTIETTGGNPGSNARIQFNDFGIPFSTNSNAAFIGDLRSRGIITLGIDVRVENISFAGTAEERDLVVELRSHALAQGGFPWTSVYVKLASLNTGDDWTSYATTFDPTSPVLPDQWGGYGATDPVTFASILPPGVTFSDVMGSVDEVAFTTLVPGYFYDPSDFDIRFDNIRINGALPTSAAQPVPSLGITTTMLLGLLLIGGLFVRRVR